MDKKPIRQVIDGEVNRTAQGKRVYSGIRATGRLHLGNYLGAVKGMLALQNTHHCIFSVVDLHTITVPYDPLTLKSSIREIILDYLAAGLDPKKCHLEIQSKVPQHTELAYLLSTIYPVSRLEDLPTYKEKKAQYPKYVNMGLLYYPVLMAADIMLFKAELVPVGIDQEPHLEIQREIAGKFNSMFGQTFPECQRFKTEGEYVPSLKGIGKMSKSVEGSYINLTDDLETIKSKVAKMPTDIGRGTIESGTFVEHLRQEKIRVPSIHTDIYRPEDKSNENVRTMSGVSSLMLLVKIFMGEERKNFYKDQYNVSKGGEGIKYSELKEKLALAIYKELQPFQEKRKEFEENSQLVDSIIKEGIETCKQEAEKTMVEVREKMGLS